MKISKFHIYLADLDPAFGTEPGKTRPVVVVQTDDINDIHTSTVVCLLTSRLRNDAAPLRVRVLAKESLLPFDSDIMTDQIRAIDNHRFKQHLGKLSDRQCDALLENLKNLILE
ncbi:MAG: type II toxin-antitoxin system PemK/MazF family toxin [Candidatus Omnitrophota bacterium]|nr:type II toxin-antitoxin system PemK/MazF family toxin [Candidatus Omnitrophota bacterium]